MFKFSTDPELLAKVTDVLGRYLDPPENAIVLYQKVVDPEVGAFHRRGDRAADSWV